MFINILFIVLFNLLLLNVLMIEIFSTFNIISLSLYQIHYTLNNFKQVYNQQNTTLICTLDCNNELKKIVNFYNNISQFKNFNKMIPIQIKKIDNNKCRILYYAESLNLPNNLIKEDKYFTLNYYKIENNCNWYITDMSAKL